MTPGLTGWAQVNGRDELPIPDKVKLDAAYLQRQSLAFDIRILWLTFVKAYPITRLVERHRWILKPSRPKVAPFWLPAAKDDAEALLLQPLMGRTRPELGRLVRSWPTSTPYILYYVSEKAGITVLRVLHHARDVRLASFDQ